MDRETKVIAIIDNRPLIIQALSDQIVAAADIQLIATGQVGDHIVPITATWSPDILLISLDIPQAENNDVIRFQPLPTLRILNRFYPKTKIIFLVTQHLPIMANLAERFGVMGYILMQDPRIASIEEVIRHVFFGRQVYSRAVKEDLFYHNIQKKGLSDTQIAIIEAFFADPNLSQQQLARTVGITHGALRNALSQLFQACGTRNMMAALMVTCALDLSQFQLSSTRG